MLELAVVLLDQNPPGSAHEVVSCLLLLLLTIPDFRPKSSFWNGRLPFTMSGVDDERSFTCTLSPYRQGELNGCARAGSAGGPYPSPVIFDDRTADR